MKENNQLLTFMTWLHVGKAFIQYIVSGGSKVSSPHRGNCGNGLTLHILGSASPLTEIQSAITDWESNFRSWGVKHAFCSTAFTRLSLLFKFLWDLEASPLAHKAETPDIGDDDIYLLEWFWNLVESNPELQNDDQVSIKLSPSPRTEITIIYEQYFKNCNNGIRSAMWTKWRCSWCKNT